MKIITEEKAYVQRNDLAYLESSSLPIPVSIFNKVFKDKTVIDDRNRYEFVEFDDPDEVEYFKEIDWMIDYNDVKDLKEQDFKNLALKISTERNKLLHRYRNMYDEDKLKNLDMLERCELLEFKIYSLRDALLFKQGELKFKLPDGVDTPKSIKNLFKIFKK